jgi:hypothetical protein
LASLSGSPTLKVSDLPVQDASAMAHEMTAFRIDEASAIGDRDARPERRPLGVTGMANLGRKAVALLYGLVIGKRTCSRAKREGRILYELSTGWAV